MSLFLVALLFAGNFCTVYHPVGRFDLRHKVVLTFDDGPNPHAETTKRLLVVLKKHNVTAYHCVVGRYARQYPDLVRQIASKGGIVVLHEGRHHANESEVAHLRDDPSSGYNRSWIPAAVDELITELKADGFEFVTFE